MADKVVLCNTRLEVQISNPPVSKVPQAQTFPSKMFDEDLYLALNPDVAVAVRAGTMVDGHTHWLQFGAQEHGRGFRPSILHALQYPANLQEQRGTLSRMLHDGELPIEFDTEGYLFLHADVRRQYGGNLAAGTEHWRTHGLCESRAFPEGSPFRNRHAALDAILARPFGVNVFGSFSAVSGLGTAARAIVRSLSTTGIRFDLWNYDSRAGYVRVAQSDRLRTPRYRVNLLLANADLVAGLYCAFQPGHFDDAYNIGLWQWELASFRPDWFTSFGSVDEVWTNSDFQRVAISASAPVPVSLIHLPVTVVASSGQSSRRSFGIPEEAFAVLCVFDVGSTTARKNPFAAINAFKLASLDRPKATLVVKYHSHRHEPAFLATLADLVRSHTNIVLIGWELSNAEMADLRSVCDCLVSAHRSEGFGLNIAEFMALGKPVVATGYSGNVDFFDDSVGFPVDFNLTELAAAAGPYPAGYVWAEPNVQSLAQQLRQVIDNPEESTRRGRNAAERIRELFNEAVIGDSMLARLRQIGLENGDGQFKEWVGRSPDRAVFRTNFAGVATRARALEGMAWLPLFSLVVPVFNVPACYLERCVRSVIEQTYSFWELCICDDGSTRQDTIDVLRRYQGVSPKIKIRRLADNSGISAASNAAAQLAVGDYLVMLDNDDELRPDALWEAARAISANPSIDCLYSDEDKIDEAGNRIDHYLKPDWSPEHLESVMYVLHMLVVRKRLFHAVGQFRPEFDGAQDYDLMLRCSRATRAIHHVRQILYRWRAIPGSAAAQVDAKPGALRAGCRALQDHAQIKYGPVATVENGLVAGTFRLRRPVNFPPRVTLLVLTGNSCRDLPGRGRVCLVDNFVDSILARTDYPNFEIVVIDNSSLSPEQKARFASLSVSVENFDLPASGCFNYAAKANFAIRCARTEQIVLLNDDMEVITADWLTSLIELSQDVEIGGVGARLLHFDGTVQHAGLVLGVDGGAAHIYHSSPGDSVGYNAFTHVIRNYSAVTGSCFATRRSVMDHVGGFDEAFAIDFNDIDLCLRIGQAGYRVVYTPYSQLYHFEQASLPRTAQNPAEVKLFADRWAAVIADDPFYNPQLTRTSLNYTLRRPFREFYVE